MPYFASNTWCVVTACCLFGALLFVLGVADMLPFPRETLPVFFAVVFVGGQAFFGRGVLGIIFAIVTLIQAGLVVFPFFEQNSQAVWFVSFFVGGLSAITVYARLIYRPTRQGQKVLAHMNGLKMFMQAVHREYPKEIDFNKMEKLLPYAILFGLEKDWIEKMKKMTASFDYQPDWYRGSRPFSYRCMRSLSSSVSSATAPRSSGSRGGGFSGGGFGGGGGGGR